MGFGVINQRALLFDARQSFGKSFGDGFDEGFDPGFEQAAQGGERFAQLGFFFAFDETVPFLFAQPVAQVFAVLRAGDADEFACQPPEHDLGLQTAAGARFGRETQEAALFEFVHFGGVIAE